MIKFQNNVLFFLDDLIYTLFENQYFGYVENSEEYVNKIVDFIKDSIEFSVKKNTPFELQNFGSNYIFFKVNARTTWYIFFEEKNGNYLITNILNNHCKEASYF